MKSKVLLAVLALLMISSAASAQGTGQNDQDSPFWDSLGKTMRTIFTEKIYLADFTKEQKEELQHFLAKYWKSPVLSRGICEKPRYEYGYMVIVFPNKMAIEQHLENLDRDNDSRKPVGSTGWIEIVGAVLTDFSINPAPVFAVFW